MKAVCAHCTQYTGAVGILYTHSCLRWDRVTHGFLPKYEGYVSFCLGHLQLFPTRVHLVQLSRYQTYRYQLSAYAPQMPSCGPNGFTWLQSASAVCTHPLRWDCHISPTCLIARYGSFHLYFRGHNKTHNHRRSMTHLIAPHEDPDQGFNYLFPYRVDVEYHHVGVCDHSEGALKNYPLV